MYIGAVSFQSQGKEPVAAKWTTDSAKAVLEGGGLRIVDQKQIDHGIQFVLSEGTPVNIFTTTGKVLVQGRNIPEKQKAMSLLNGPQMTVPAVPMVTAAVRDAADPALSREAQKKIFIVYGHDTQSRNDLELLLLRLGLQPFILSNQAPDGKTIIEALIANSDATYAIVLLTPDDEGHRAGAPTEKHYRARQNVVLELGMFLMKLGRERVAILHKGNIELPSDINGLIYISFADRVSEAKNKLAASLQKAGFFIDIGALSAE